MSTSYILVPAHKGGKEGEGEIRTVRFPLPLRGKFPQCMQVNAYIRTRCDHIEWIRVRAIRDVGVIARCAVYLREDYERTDDTKISSVSILLRHNSI